MPAGIPSSQFPKVDHHEIAETFADSLGQATFDGQTLRIEFCAVRLDEIKGTSGKRPPGSRHLVARLVLSPEGAIELINAVGQITAIMKQTGVIKTGPNPTMPPTSAMKN